MQMPRFTLSFFDRRDVILAEAPVTVGIVSADWA